MSQQPTNPLRRRFLQAIPAGIILSTLAPFTGAAKSHSRAISLGYAPPIENNSNSSTVFPASLLPDSDQNLATTGAYINLDSFIAPDIADYFDLNLTLFNNATVATGETIACLIWQLSAQPVYNCSAPAHFFVPLTGGKLSLTLQGRLQQTRNSTPIEWQQPVSLSLNPQGPSVNLRAGTFFIPLMSQMSSGDPDWLSHKCEQQVVGECTQLHLKPFKGELPDFSFLQLTLEPVLQNVS